MKIHILLLTCIAALIYSAQAAAKKPVIVGGETDYPPYCFLDENGKPAGFQVDLARAAARVMGIEIEIKLSTWAETRKGLDGGTIDIISGMFYSEERAQIYDFSPPYTIVSSVIFARKNSPPITSIDDLRGRHIIVMRGEAMHDYALKHTLTQNLILAETPGDVLRKLSAGKADYALGAHMPGLYWIKKLGLSNITTTGKPLKPFKNCFSVRKGNTLLLSQFTEGLTILNKTGEHQKLYEKWFALLDTDGVSFKKVLKYIVIIIVPLFALLIIALIWTWTLRRTVARRTSELFESRQQLKTLSDNIPDGYMYQILSDGEQRSFTYISAGVEKLHGISAKDALSDAKILYNQIIEEDRPLMHERESQIKKSMTRFLAEIRYRRPDGELRWLLITSSPRKISDNSIIADGLAIDITDRKITEENLILSLKEKQTLLRELYHRTRNNMNVIQSMLIMHSSNIHEPGFKEVLIDIGNRINSMSLVHQKLYQSKSLSYIDLHDYTSDLFNSLYSSYSISSRKISFNINNIHIPVLIDIAIPCGLVLNELFTNSLKYAFPDNSDGTISVAINKKDESTITINYSDNGIGLSDNFNIQDSGGMGIQIIKMIVEFQLKGSIHFDSQNGMLCVISFISDNYTDRVSDENSNS